MRIFFLYLKSNDKLLCKTKILSAHNHNDNNLNAFQRLIYCIRFKIYELFWSSNYCCYIVTIFNNNNNNDNNIKL